MASFNFRWVNVSLTDLCQYKLVRYLVTKAVVVHALKIASTKTKTILYSEWPCSVNNTYC